MRVSVCAIKRKNKLFSAEVRVHAKIVEHAAFSRALCSYFLL